MGHGFGSLRSHDNQTGIWVLNQNIAPAIEGGLTQLACVVQANHRDIAVLSPG